DREEPPLFAVRIGHGVTPEMDNFVKLHPSYRAGSDVARRSVIGGRTAAERAKRANGSNCRSRSRLPDAPDSTSRPSGTARPTLSGIVRSSLPRQTSQILGRDVDQPEAGFRVGAGRAEVGGRGPQRLADPRRAPVRVP